MNPNDEYDPSAPPDWKIVTKKCPFCFMGIRFPAEVLAQAPFFGNMTCPRCGADMLILDLIMDEGEKQFARCSVCKKPIERGETVTIAKAFLFNPYDGKERIYCSNAECQYQLYNDVEKEGET